MHENWGAIATMFHVRRQQSMSESTDCAPATLPGPVVTILSGLEGASFYKAHPQFSITIIKNNKKLKEDALAFKVCRNWKLKIE